MNIKFLIAFLLLKEVDSVKDLDNKCNFEIIEIPMNKINCIDWASDVKFCNSLYMPTKFKFFNVVGPYKTILMYPTTIYNPYNNHFKLLADLEFTFYCSTKNEYNITLFVKPNPLLDNKFKNQFANHELIYTLLIILVICLGCIYIN